MEQFLAKIRENINNPQNIENIFKGLKNDEIVLFKEAISILKTEDETNDIYSYWFYKLKVLERYPETEEKKGLFNLLSIKSLVFGLLTGVLFYIIIENKNLYDYNRDTILMTLLAVTGILGLTGYFISEYKKVVNKVVLSLSIFQSVLILTILNFFEFSRSYEVFVYAISIPFIVLITIGLNLSAISEKKENLVKSFYYFIYKSIEIFIVFLIISLAVTIIGALFTQLLKTIRFNIDDDIYIFLIISTYTIIFFISTSIVYDFNKSVSEQKSYFNLINLISKLFTFLTYSNAIFLFGYILLLIPSAFGLTLRTGHTTDIFSSIVSLNLFYIFIFSISLDFLKISNLSKFKKVIYFAVFIENYILIFVAFYAIIIRINEYGLSIERIIFLFFISGLLIINSLFFINYLKNIFKLTNIGSYINYFKQIIFLSIIIILTEIILILFIDFQTISINSHFNIIKRKHSVENKLERYYFADFKQKSISVLKENYENSNTLLKTDILLTMERIKSYHYYKGSIKEPYSETINYFKSIEKNQQVLNLIEKISNMDSNNYLSHEDCIYHTTTILNSENITTISHTQINNFCY